jgi:hypothetical protein
VLIVVISEYIFQLNTYVNTQKSYDYSLDLMNKLTPVTDDYALYDFIRSYHTSNTDFLILEITHTEEGTVKKYVFDDYNDYRSQEYVIIEDGNFEVYILLRDELKAEAY